jgi:uncharacterized membrane protein
MTARGAPAKPRAGLFHPASMTETLFMDSIIRPNRSLSPDGRRKVILVFAGLSLVPAVIFMRAGALPVLIYIALVVAAVIAALAASARRGETHERVRVSARRIEVSRHAPGGETLVWESATAFTRVTLSDEDLGQGALKLQLSGREIQIGRDLSRPERLAFARHLKLAMSRATASDGGSARDAR